MQPRRTGPPAGAFLGTASALPPTPPGQRQSGETSPDPGPRCAAAEHGRDAAREIYGIPGPHRDGARIGLAVVAIIECARPLVGAGPLGILHDDKSDDGSAAHGRIGVLIVRPLPVGHFGELGAQAFAPTLVEF